MRPLFEKVAECYKDHSLHFNNSTSLLVEVDNIANTSPVKRGILDSGIITFTVHHGIYGFIHDNRMTDTRPFENENTTSVLDFLRVLLWHFLTVAAIFLQVWKLVE